MRRETFFPRRKRGGLSMMSSVVSVEMVLTVRG